MSVDLVAVVGAGIMGTGVAQSLAQSGHLVLLLDTSQSQLEAARAGIRRTIRMQALLDKTSKPTEGAGAILDRIKPTTNYEDLAEADFVIENVVEKWSVKERVYETLDRVCPGHAIFGANTSAISITRIASATSRPERVVGMHFMNPVPLKPVIEVIRGHHTTDETIQSALDLLAVMGKSGVVVNDMPGFVSNRVLMLTINEAIFLVQDRVASAEDVDRIFKSCFGHKMGPLETADLIGLDTILLSLEVLYESYNDDKYRPSPLLKKMVYANLHGRKTGQGFYTYANDF